LSEDGSDRGEWPGYGLPKPRVDMDENLQPKRAGLVARIYGENRIIDKMTCGVPTMLHGKRPGMTITK